MPAGRPSLAELQAAAERAQQAEIAARAQERARLDSAADKGTDAVQPAAGTENLPTAARRGARSFDLRKRLRPEDPPAPPEIPPDPAGLGRHIDIQG